jgi:hypothetical protein
VLYDWHSQTPNILLEILDGSEPPGPFLRFFRKRMGAHYQFWPGDLNSVSVPGISSRSIAFPPNYRSISVKESHAEPVRNSSIHFLQVTHLLCPGQAEFAIRFAVRSGKSIALKVFAKLRRGHTFSQIIPAVWVMWRAFPVTRFGTAGNGEAQPINWPDFEEANKCGNGHETCFRVSVQDDFRWTDNASGKWHQCRPEAG